jgi:hypothetical protein
LQQHLGDGGGGPQVSVELENVSFGAVVVVEEIGKRAVLKERNDALVGFFPVLEAVTS